MVTALEARVPGAAGHAERVASQSRLVARRLGLDPREVRLIECGARVHDVGKIIVSPESSIVRHHHERIDGSGYPDRLRGVEIPIGSRIVAVTDTFDALTSARPYREAFSAGDAIELLEAEAGFTLDPKIVTAFVA